MEHITGTASKAAEQAARIAGVLTLWNDLDAAQVSQGTIANAIELARFYLVEAARLADAAIVSREIERAESLKRWLHKKWQEPEVMVRDVVQRGPNQLCETPTARAVLTTLEQHGHLNRLDAGTVVRGAAREDARTIVRYPTTDF